MATKEANLKAIRAIEKERGIDVIVTGLSAAEVADKLDQLLAEGTDSVAEEAQVVVDTAVEEITTEEPAKEQEAVYVVPKGKALVCRRGVLGEGKEIGVSDISGGQKCFDVLVESKNIVTKKEYNA